MITSTDGGPPSDAARPPVDGAMTDAGASSDAGASFDADTSSDGAASSDAALPPTDGATLDAGRSWRELFVATTGSDTNPGTRERPFATIERASRAATPGTLVHVAPGEYAGSIRTEADGTAADPIVYLSDVGHGAVLVPPSGTRVDAWDDRGDYVEIDGFEIDGRGGPTWRNGIIVGGSHVTVRNCHVHDIATTTACTSAGGSGINTHAYWDGVDNHIVGNLVHDIGAPGCRFVQGIYHSTTGSIVNNVVYRIGAAAIHLWHDAHELVIANNTVTDSDIGIVIGAGDWYDPARLPADDVHVTNNIVARCTSYGILETGRTGTHNTYANNLVYRAGTEFRLLNDLRDTGTVRADPRLVGPEDHHLLGDSPAIDAGDPLRATATDFDGHPRDAAPDIGAHEHR